MVAVVDLFRDEAGPQFPASKLYIGINGSVIDAYPINLTRQSFIFRGLSIDTRINQGNRLQYYLSEAPLPGVLLRLRASIFFVPSGCSFGETTRD